MLHFVRGRVGSGKTKYITEKIATSKEKALLLVPEMYSHSAERRLCKTCGNRVSEYAEVTSFRRLATAIKAETGGVADVAIDDGRRMLLLYIAAKDSASALCRLKGLENKGEALYKVMRAIDELKTYGATPEKISRASQSVSKNLSDKLSDLAKIYAAYENALGDERDAYGELELAVRNLKNSSFFEGKTVYLDGFSGFNAAEFDIIEEAMCRAKEVYITLETPEKSELGEENGIFDKAFETRARLCDRAARHLVKVEDIYLRGDEKSGVLLLDEALYGDRAESLEFSSVAVVARGESIFEECELAAAYILDTVRKEGARYRDFCVSSAGGEYDGILESTLERYGIPVYSAEKSNLPDKPIIALIISALDCVVRGFAEDAVMPYLKTGFSGICRRSLDIFENYLYMWSPKRSDWSKEAFTKNPFGLSAEVDEESEARLRLINKIREKIKTPIMNLKRRLSEDRSGFAAAEAIYEFICEINLPRRCEAYARLMQEKGRLKEAQEYDKLISILYSAIDSLGRTLGEREIKAEELLTLFKIVVSQYELGTIPASLDSVNICSISHAGGERKKYQLILGTHEGAFPSGEESVGIFTDSDRRELAELGVSLAPELSKRISEQFFDIHSAILSATEKVYLSIAAVDGRGEARTPSAITERVRALTNADGGFDIHTARLMAKAPCFDECVAVGSAASIFGEDEEYRDRLKTAELNAKVPRGPIIKKENIDAVFGRNISMSASRADSFSSCRYAYFLKYGLRAEEKRKAEISPLEAGVLMHYVLENSIKKLSLAKDYSEERAEAVAREAFKEYIETRLGGDEDMSERTRFLLRRLERTVLQAVSDICEELLCSDFSPCEFELSFRKHDGDLPPIMMDGEDFRISFNGAVDRVDSFEAEDGRLYLRVVDYKSSRKKFSLDETVNGIGMQMLLYLFALQEIGTERYGKEIAPAGVLYVPIIKEKGKEAKREGIILNDVDIARAMDNTPEGRYIPISYTAKGAIKKGSAILSEEDFGKIKKRTREILLNIGKELSSGVIEANPYQTSERSSCTYCEYASVCKFDEKNGEDKRRPLFEIRAEDITGGGEADA